MTDLFPPATTMLFLPARLTGAFLPTCAPGIDTLDAQRAVAALARPISPVFSDIPGRHSYLDILIQRVTRYADAVRAPLRHLLFRRDFVFSADELSTPEIKYKRHRQRRIETVVIARAMFEQRMREMLNSTREDDVSRKLRLSFQSMRSRIHSELTVSRSRL